MGTILLAGIDGALFDHLRLIGFQWRHFRLAYLFFWVMGTLMALWSFVYIVDARNGIGLSSILYGFWFVCALVMLIHGQIDCVNLRGALVFCLPLQDYWLSCTSHFYKPRSIQAGPA